MRLNSSPLKLLQSSVKSPFAAQFFPPLVSIPRCGVRSSKVDLGKHVGHTVTATGVVWNATMHNLKEDTKDAAKDSGMNNEHGHFKITAVKMVSESCK